jgi:hypothetical protein
LSDQLQLHDDSGDTCDTASSLRVPVVLVPGVMGSRLDLTPSLSWDPDGGSPMAPWISFSTTGRREVRRALRPATTAGSVKTTFATGAVSWISGKIDASLTGKTAVLASARCRAIGTVNGGSSDDAIQSYYATFRNWGSVLWGFYGKMLVALEETLNPAKDDPDFPVYAFGYDWRRSNTDSGKLFNAFVSKVVDRHGAQDAIIITHSMGGLVARGGIAADTSVKQKIRGVIHTVQPSNGAVSAYRRFLTGVSEPVDSQALGPAWLLSNIMGPTSVQFAYNLSGMPGPLQLLPNKLHASHVSDWIAGVDSSVNLADIYNVYRQASVPGLSGIVAGAEESLGTDDERQSQAVRGDFARNLSTAEQFHDGVGTVAHGRTFALYSTGLPTDCGVTFQNLSGSISAPDSKPARQWARDADGNWVDQWNEAVYGQPPTGDGTVPDTSGDCPDMTLLAPAEAIQSNGSPLPVEHAKAMSDPTFMGRVIDLVNLLKTPPPSP